jgi:enterochelin esterase-like enzyme
MEGGKSMLPKILTVSLMIFALNLFAEEVKWPKPPAGFSAAGANIPKGKLSGVLQCPTIDKYGNRPFRIYTPPGYSATRAEKYPVLYLHHGIGGNESAWTSSEGNADKVMDFLYAQASLNVTPMLVVMPNGNVNGDWNAHEDVLINYLAPYIQANYNASSDPNMRAIAGLSMGAGQTLNIGYKNPKVFTWIGAFSPAPNTVAAGTTIKDMAGVKANVHLNFLAAGTTETGYLNTARTYHNYLNQNGVTNLYLQVEQGLNHEPENWNRQLHNFAQRIFKGTTGIAPVKSTRMVPVSAHKTILINNGLSQTPWGIHIARTATSPSKPAVFSLDGRAIISQNPGKSASQTIDPNK